MKQLSRSESKYRTKFIQECHFNKYYQKMLDEEVTKSQLTYKIAYTNFHKNISNNLSSKIFFSGLSQTFYKFGISTEHLLKNMSILNNSLFLTTLTNQYIRVKIV